MAQTAETWQTLQLIFDPLPQIPSYSFTTRSAAGGFQQEQRSKSSEVLSRGQCPTKPNDTASPTQLLQISPCLPKGRTTCSSGPTLAFFLHCNLFSFMFLLKVRQCHQSSSTKTLFLSPSDSCDVTKSNVVFLATTGLGVLLDVVSSALLRQASKNMDSRYHKAGPQLMRLH